MRDTRKTYARTSIRNVYLGVNQTSRDRRVNAIKDSNSAGSSTIQMSLSSSPLDQSGRYIFAKKKRTNRETKDDDRREGENSGTRLIKRIK